MWPLDKRTEDVTLDLFCSSNLWNGVSIYRRNGDSVESWEFAGKRKDEGLQNLFINEKELIEKFIRYFNQTARELIDCSDEEKLVTYTNEVNMVPIEDHLLQQKELLLENLDLKTELAIQGRYGVVSISYSYQQAKCLDHLANGKTIKEIAKAMALSPRTIEDYLRKIKEKIGHTSRCDLVQAYQNRSA